MLQNGIDYTPDVNTRRISTSNSAINAGTLSRVFAQTNTIDISKFIALLDAEGVTVTGGEPQLDPAGYDDVKRCWTQPGIGTGTLGGPGYGQSFNYEIKADAFTATVKYGKSASVRTIELLTILRPGTSGGMVVYGRQIRREQGDAVLNKCDSIMAACVAKVRREQQDKFDMFIAALDMDPTA